MNEQLFIEKIRHSEINEVAGILTDAFKTNPAYSIIFKKKNQLEDGLLWLFRANLFIHNEKQALTRVVKEKNTGKIVGTFTLIPPQGLKSSLFIYSKIDIPGFILTFGLTPLIRTLSLDRCNKNVLKESIKASEYHYLSMVVIKKEYRGKGIGSYTIKSVIQELTSSDSTCNLLGLTTQLPENVRFYSRLGFNIIDEGYVDFKKDRYYNYNMKLDLKGLG
ncbi:MAG: GNAT family N-acetyltransferase [Tannerellaceae bacterium]|jgi:GNAT superfamily N-acetyltransferase|nr:GNAT family N-acetyltransferase [Tannerellaceae bacterium]